MNENAEIQVGRPAFDVTVEKEGDEAVPLSNFWKDATLVAVFMRHLG